MATPPANLSPAAAQVVVELPEITVTASQATDPNAAVNGSPQVSDGIKRFPSDTPMYYTTIGVHKYSRASWASVGQLSPAETTIVLPMPEQLIDSWQQNYDTTPLGLVGGIAMTGAGAAGGVAAGTTTVKNVINSALNSARGVAGRVGVGLLDSAARAVGAPGVVPGVLASQGKTINDYLTVLYKGPAYKSFQFSWKMSPRSAAESRAIKDIEVALKNAQAPSWTGVGFFSWPRILSVSFSYAGPGVDMSTRLFALKPGIIRQCAFNYAPGGVPGFYGASQYPEGVAFQLAFEEIELWVNSNNDTQDAVTNPNANDADTHDTIGAIGEYQATHPPVVGP